jgi:hypothetical protein
MQIYTCFFEKNHTGTAEKNNIYFLGVRQYCTVFRTIPEPVHSQRAMRIQAS